MPFSAKNNDWSQVKFEAAEITKIEISTLANPTTPELVLTILGRGGRYRVEPQTADTIYGTRTVFYTHIIEFDLADLATPANSTTTPTAYSTEKIIYELQNLPAAFVRITKRNGVQRTLSSGTDNVPIMQFSVGKDVEGNLQVGRVRGVGYTSVEEVTV